MRILEPSTVEPLRVDLRRVVLVAMGLWLVALVVLGALALAGAPTGRGVWICLVGFALGFWALAWDRRHPRV